jgi:UDP-N-acetylmuramoyl-L-alanyl-D-glutamate--2,6-diaminopimelate ligase
MRFDKLFAGIASPELLAEHAACEVTGLADDSRQVQPGTAFVAVRGASVDGHQFIDRAGAAGAAVIVAEEPRNAPPDALVVIVPDTRVALATLAWRWYGLESRFDELTLLAVTGTNGKSTTALLTQAILQHAGWRCGVIGTLYYDLGEQPLPAPLTTPGTLLLAESLRKARDNGLHAVVMETSSHALDQRRTAGLPFRAAAFTNLTQDHLDYHGTFEAYAAAKALLFKGLDATATAVVNVDDPHHATMLAECPASVLRFGMRAPADVSATVQAATIAGTEVDLQFGDAQRRVSLPLVGAHNVANVLAAVGLATAAGIGFDDAVGALPGVAVIPGRLERVACQCPAQVFVDYAHTPDALDNVCRVLRPLTVGRLRVVFGCGGDRDRSKRPLMAAAVARYADEIFLTSDNPRTEDPTRIIADAYAGFSRDTQERVVTETDRRAAIKAALNGTAADDVVLIAGKGHEDYQVIGTEKKRFDDREVARAEATQLFAAEPRPSSDEVLR